MEVELPQPLAKRKKIKKKAEKPSLHSNLTLSTPTYKEKSLATKAVRKYSKLVNLPKQEVGLGEKQSIFRRVVESVKEKAGRKERKKQRVLIKKVCLM